MKWKEIKSFPCIGFHYEVSDFGQVRKFTKWSGYTKTESVIRKTDREGYRKVTLFNEDKARKTYFVHDLVAEAFLPNPDGVTTVRHVNGFGYDNSVKNLKWQRLK